MNQQNLCKWRHARSRDYSPLRPLVLALLIELLQLGRDDGRACTRGSIIPRSIALVQQYTQSWKNPVGHTSKPPMTPGVKALHSTASSAPEVRPIEEQVAKPATVADPKTIKSAPRVINVDKYAAYPKAIAALKAAGILPEAVELRQVKYLNNLVEQDHLLSSDWSSQGWASFPSRWHGERVPGIRGHEYDKDRTGTQRGEERHQGPSHPQRQPVCSSGLS